MLELLTELFHLERESQRREEHNWISERKFIGRWKGNQVKLKA